MATRHVLAALLAVGVLAACNVERPQQHLEDITEPHAWFAFAPGLTSCVPAQSPRYMIAMANRAGGSLYPDELRDNDGKLVRVNLSGLIPGVPETKWSFFISAAACDFARDSALQGIPDYR